MNDLDAGFKQFLVEKAEDYGDLLVVPDQDIFLFRYNDKVAKLPIDLKAMNALRFCLSSLLIGYMEHPVSTQGPDESVDEGVALSH